MSTTYLIVGAFPIVLLLCLLCLQFGSNIWMRMGSNDWKRKPFNQRIWELIANSLVLAFIAGPLGVTILWFGHRGPVGVSAALLAIVISVITWLYVAMVKADPLASRKRRDTLTALLSAETVTDDHGRQRNHFPRRTRRRHKQDNPSQWK